MDFEQIIAGIALEYDAAKRLEDAEEVAELAEAELVSVELSDRLRGLVGREVRLVSQFDQAVAGRVLRVNPAWIVLEQMRIQELVLVESIAMVEGLSKVAPDASFIDKRLGVAAILRQLMRRKAPVLVRVGLATISGYIVAVYKDHIDVSTTKTVCSVSLQHIFSIRLGPDYSA